MPSHMSEPGGRKVGEQMTHYIIAGNAFDRACAELLTREFKLMGLTVIPERPRLALPSVGGGEADTTKALTWAWSSCCPSSR